ncbi:MAG: S41 family peptidase [Tepidiformaceae bacterium]
MLAVITLAFGLGWGVNDLTSDSSGSASSGSQDAVGASIISEIYDVLKSNYVDKSTLNADAIKQAAINGVISSLNDPHTTYLSPDDLRAGALNLDSTYQGIGASVATDNGQLQVTPFRDSPAQKAGMKAGDIVLTVDGQKTDGWSTEQAVDKIRGAKGTTVSLGVKHSDGALATVTVKRDDIPIQSVFTEPQLEIIPNKSGTGLVDSSGAPVTNLAYLNISQFHDKTYDELVTQLNAMQGKDYKGLILDMRGNHGGLLDSVISIADEFLDKGTILTEKDAGGQTQTWTAKPGGLETTLPIVILMDKSSASGAEVLAGALHDNGRAKIVGTRSFGKGTVNQLHVLTGCGDPNGCGDLYLSVGRWFTPDGTQIEGVGIKPDYEVDMSTADYQSKGDIQMFKAIDLLEGKQ